MTDELSLTFQYDTVIDKDRLKLYEEAVRHLAGRAMVDIISGPNQPYEFVTRSEHRTVSGVLDDNHFHIRVSGFFPSQEGLSPFHDAVRRLKNDNGGTKPSE